MPVRSRSRAARGEPRIPVVDLFAGPGGLGEGFSAPDPDGTPSRFRIALSIEKDPIAHETLELRAAFRHFDYGDAPGEYYELLRSGLDRAALFAGRTMSGAVAAARTEAWKAELGVTPRDEVRNRVQEALKGTNESVLIGGPPCQAYSLVGRSRNRGNPAYQPEADGRHSLYREYLRVLATHWPAVFVMENVKGLLSAQLNGQSIFSRILEDLHNPHGALRRPGRLNGGGRYSIIPLTADTNGQVELIDTAFPDPSRFVVRCEEYGIPQARHRVILLGVREDVPIPPGVMLQPRARVSVGEILSELPPLRSGLSGGRDSKIDWRETLATARKQTWLRRLWSQDIETAECIDRSIERAQRRRLTRGSPFVEGEVRLGAHADWYIDPRLEGVTHHVTRGHIPGDLVRYLFAAAFAKVHGRSPVLGDFPEEILPSHSNVASALNGSMFQDRFRVQLAGRPASTVTSHISKDGHYYIHYDPVQCRSLTVREAARLQTFPDNYFFCGGRTAQYHQIGNAVPPLLARDIARLVSSILR